MNKEAHVTYETTQVLMKEQYVTYETAKLLKEKGFDWKCNISYGSQDTLIDYTMYGFIDEDNLINAPTQQMACNWLREEHEIDIIPIIRHSLKYAQESPFRDYACRVYDCDGKLFCQRLSGIVDTKMPLKRH